MESIVINRCSAETGRPRERRAVYRYVCSGSIVEIAGSNPAESVDVRLLWLLRVV